MSHFITIPHPDKSSIIDRVCPDLSKVTCIGCPTQTISGIFPMPLEVVATLARCLPLPWAATRPLGVPQKVPTMPWSHPQGLKLWQCSAVYHIKHERPWPWEACPQTHPNCLLCNPQAWPWAVRFPLHPIDASLEWFSAFWLAVGGGLIQGT